MNTLRRLRALALLAVALCAGVATVSAQTNSSVRDTKHNLGANSTRNPNTNAVRAADGQTDQVCVFCHTPHAANSAAPAPLWNRSLSSQTYSTYRSESLDAQQILGTFIGQPGGASKLCLSCHDGTLALGTVTNAPGSGAGNTSTTPITMLGTPDGKMPAGSGTTTGYTRNLGTDLRNDHPISFTFNGTLTTRDGELRTPPYVSGGKSVVGPRTATSKPLLPLDHDNHVQCTTCHDPHLQGDSTKFLRLSRFQSGTSPSADFDASKDQICLGCHARGAVWGQSAHGNSTTANYAYKGPAATQREFTSTTTTSRTVYEAGCLNCHDTHAVQGSRRLLREGTDGAGSPKAGGNPAQEQTCYQCHTTSTASVITVPTMTATTGVPDIQTEFGRARRMPIVSADQPGGGTERHDIGGNFNDSYLNSNCTTSDNKCGADFMESRERLGANNHANRHVECTDCHNPHRVVKNSLFTGTGTLQNGSAGNQRTHVVGGVNGNLASGALRGAWGVEPVYSDFSGAWPNPVSNYIVKRGDPATSVTTARTAAYLTREYQLCLKCHSDYGFGSTPPPTGGTGLTGDVNGMGTRYTNVAAEFGVSATDYGGSLGTLTGTHQCEGENDTSCTPVGSTWDTFTTQASTHNHRSWHPVHYPTGRTAAERSNNGTGGDTNFKVPFKASLGIQTMYCSDCHGNAASWTDGTGPNLAQVQGPHGSENNFLLKGTWDPTIRDGNISAGGTGTTATAEGLCGNCHVGSVSRTDSGWGSADTSGHNSSEHGKRCGYCHIAVPHGWKNKAFLVNLNCVGPEGGASGNCVSNVVGNQSALTKGPYYIGATLRVRTWRASRQWTESSCGSPSASGENWMDGTC